MQRLVAYAIVFLTAYASSAQGGDWPQWRGPEGNGVSQTTDVPLKWSEDQNIQWKTNIPGLGWSSPVILGNQIWLTTAETIEATAEERAQRKKAITNSQPVKIVKQISMFAVCLDKTSGKILHHIRLMDEHDPDPVHVENSYATPTPIVEPGRVYCHFGTHGTAAVDTHSGEIVWTNQSIRLNHENGPGGSPVVHGDILTFHCDGSDVQFIIGLNKHTGRVEWKTDRSGKLNPHPQMKKSYCTPLLAKIGGKTELISAAADWVYGYEPDTGNELWKVSFGGLGFSNSSRPVYSQGMIYLCTGFMRSKLLAIQREVGTSPSIAWSYERQVSQVASPLIIKDRLYMISDRGVATCLHAKTGEPIWQKRVGGNFWASPTYIDGHIFFSSKTGETTVIAAGDEFEIVERNQLEGIIMASLAAVDNALFLRTDKALYRIGY